MPPFDFKTTAARDKLDATATWNIDGYDYDAAFDVIDWELRVWIHTMLHPRRHEANTREQIDAAIEAETVAAEGYLEKVGDWFNQAAITNPPSVTLVSMSNNGRPEAILRWDQAVSDRNLKIEAAGMPGDKTLEVRVVVDNPQQPTQPLRVSVNTKQELDEAVNGGIEKALKLAATEYAKTYATSVRAAYSKAIGEATIKTTTVKNLPDQIIWEHLFENRRIWLVTDPRAQEVAFSILVEVEPGTADAITLEGKNFLKVSGKEEMEALPKFASKPASKP